jgi:hypothetical protein
MLGPAYLHSPIGAELFLSHEFPSAVSRLTACFRRKSFPIYVPVLVILAALSISGDLLAQTTINASGGNGMVSLEGTTIASSNGSLTAASDSIWADTTNHRWLMSNYGATGVTVASWPCTGTAGCMTYSTGSMVPYTETALSVGSAVTGAFLQLASGPAPTWSAYTFPASGCSTGYGLIASSSSSFACAGSPFAQTGTTNTFSTKQTFAASTTSLASINIPAGTTPTSPTDGDKWYDTNQQAEAFRQDMNTTVYRGERSRGA